ncbi:MAG: hypothetical protein O7C65_03335 [Planctomycetota bacterium]|nr:hypothetical protein [Planctomycetota bacterium]
MHAEVDLFVRRPLRCAVDLRRAEVLLEAPFFAAVRLAEERAEALRVDLIDFFVGIDATPRWFGRFDV